MCRTKQTVEYFALSRYCFGSTKNLNSPLTMHKQLIVWAAIFITCIDANVVHTTDTTSPSSQVNVTMTSFSHGKISGEKRRIPGREGRIYGGTEIKPYSWPFMVQLYAYSHNRTYLCGGIVYNESYVITAAHCVTSDTPYVNVTAGEHSLFARESQEQIRTVSRIVKHPGFNAYTDHDIALLELSSPLDLKTPYVTAIEINTDLSCPAPKDKCSIAGWGRLSSGSRPTYPYEADLSGVRSQDCNMTHNDTYRDNILNTVICVVDSKSGKSPCSGDSGGPLVCFCGGIKKLVGVTSQGKDCGSLLYPSLYTRVFCYSEWIRTGLVNYPCKSRNISILQSVSGSNFLSLVNIIVFLCIFYWCATILFTDDP